MSWLRGAVSITKNCRQRLLLLQSSLSNTTKYNSHSLRYNTNSTKSISPSPVDSNILRILRKEIQYHSDYTPTHQLATEYETFEVEDRPGEQWITLRRKLTEDDENIKIEATMFDSLPIDPKSGVKEQARLHINLLVDVWKGDGTELLEFVCSAWPDSLEIQKVYVFRRDRSLVQPYMGPDMKNLNPKLRTEFDKFLKTRGIDDGLAEFLHDYMMKKDRIEFIQWLNEVQYYFDI